MNNKRAIPTCWICMDHGMVFFNKYIYGIKYEFAYRCKCKLGQFSSSSIMTVPEDFAENMALENYSGFKKFNGLNVSDESSLKSLCRELFP